MTTIIITAQQVEDLAHLIKNHPKGYTGRRIRRVCRLQGILSDYTTSPQVIRLPFVLYSTMIKILDSSIFKGDTAELVDKIYESVLDKAKGVLCKSLKFL